MHLLATQAGAISDGNEAVDLGQSPGEIVILSAADSELACLAAARQNLGDEFPSVRLANLMQLGHNLSVDLYVEQVVCHARIVIVRLLGGVAYWPYGVERISGACRAANIPVVFVPGDDQPDAELQSLSTVGPDAVHGFWEYMVHGGVENGRNLMATAAQRVGYELEAAPARPLLRTALYWPSLDRPDLDSIAQQWREAAPVAGLIFYRALVQGGATAPVDALITALADRCLNPLPIYVSSLKDPTSAALIARAFEEFPPDVILNATGFAVSRPGAARVPTPFEAADCPVLQVVFSGGHEATWRESARGLLPRDLAMNVVLPEVDGRIFSRAISFKAEARFDARTEHSVATYAPVTNRVAFVAELARAWARLRRNRRPQRKIALVLANYPNRAGRVGNGVGLDTPASTIAILQALAQAGYCVEGMPRDGAELIRLAQSVISRPGDPRAHGARGYALEDYCRFFVSLPGAVRDAVTARWGEPENDPSVIDGRFAVPVVAFGNVVVIVQPSRGYNVDPVKSYHDPALVPPHGYLATYGWLREEFGAHAIVHVGKHGNLEWLPGKAVALSEDCFPEAALGPVPHLYPFIVNDPGEGTQAKRRAQAVIVDHLTPPLTRADSYGPLKDLEALVDEYYEAAGVDTRRLGLLRTQILELARYLGLDHDCGFGEDTDDESALSQLDNYLCEIKEMQIRDGLHIFGHAPTGRQRDDLLTALVRVPRNAGEGADASLARALSADLGFDGFDPLDCEMASRWVGRRPAVLTGISDGPWRTCGDTVERIELLSAALISGEFDSPRTWSRTRAVLDHVSETVRQNVEQSGVAEIDGLLAGLDGRFVTPGPSGAPTRGRLDVLPTGRNFYSVDNRTVPTPAAWQLGWKSANLLIDDYRQREGSWPEALVVSAWGTANMRTGGEDIAQALAMMGVRPTWDSASRRVTAFEILPVRVLGRPRVDVTLRASGFFRDAFPTQLDLLDSAARAVAALDEPPRDNPMVARVQADTKRLIAEGTDAEVAASRAAHRIFGSMPGAYGAGLQALIDERCWESDVDLARAYLAWGGYAYGGGADGRAEHRMFERRLAGAQIVVHNQDNREHDLLDSDDYYQFEGGATAAIRHLSGEQPVVYHNDHSRPERPRIRTLQDEIGRVVRARVVNPKWIAGVMRHGYKGAFEIAATVDYLFAFAATTRMVADHHFDLVYDAFVEDKTVRGFMDRANPAAAREVAERLTEAQERGLWKPRSNRAPIRLRALAGQKSRETS